MKELPAVLIVDDTLENLILVKTILRRFEVNVIEANSGLDALERITGLHDELALAIIDVMMPGMDGYELALKINKERKGNPVPVIFVTAFNHSELEVFKGYDSGAVDYLFKPVNVHVLQKKISIFLDLFNHKQTIRWHAQMVEKFAENLIETNTALKKSEEKYRSYIDSAPDGVFIADETGRYIEVNEAACRLTGYSKEELLKMSISEILSPESVNEGIESFMRLAVKGESKDELMYRHKNGTSRWWSVEAVKLSGSRFLGFAKDVTEKKKAEQDLENSLEELRRLTQYIEKVRDEERLTISRELHDDLGQALTAVKIDLGLIKRSMKEKRVIKKIDEVTNLVGETIKTVQRLTSNLRPQILDDLGLMTAIEWYSGEFAQRTGIGMYLNIDSVLAISAEASHVIFRIMQESLTNIARHSKATTVEIGLYKTDDIVTLSISDNGIGITDSQLESKKSFGIINMRERTASLGGTFHIKAGKDCGTEVILQLPYHLIKEKP